ncbi:MAG: phosphotransferase, partial [Deltaproteobacteria bacterium]|nr:phosphotransferase [Deltaproteobacteria bacterium]
MRPYDQLTRLGQLRRIRKLAESALETYGMSNPRLIFLRYFANITYRVEMPGKISPTRQSSPYVPNCYLLRVLRSGNWEFAKGEMIWLAALSNEAGLPVPKPVPTLEGDLLTRISAPGVPGGRIVSLMQWVDGRKRTKDLHLHHFKSWGKMVGRLHAFSSKWTPPEGFKRFIWDWDGLLSGRGFNCTVDELVTSMPEAIREPFMVTSEKTRSVMKSLGKGSDAYGMIHGDMYAENVLFKAGEIFPIDFEDCGFGYWLWDIAVALGDEPWIDAWYQKRDAFLEGYLQAHPLPDSQLKYLDEFITTDAATSVLWASQFIHDEPGR